MSHLGQDRFLILSDRATELQTCKIGEVVDAHSWSKVLVA